MNPRSHKAGMPDPATTVGQKSLLRILSLAFFTLALMFLLWAVWYRLNRNREDNTTLIYGSSLDVPQDFRTDRRPDAMAFRSVCSQCHRLPSPYIYDEVGWRGVVNKMAGLIAERGLPISQEQINRATAYLVKNAPDRLSHLRASIPGESGFFLFPNLKGLEGPVVDAILSARQEVAAHPASADAWGSLGMTFQAHLMFDEAVACYRQAKSLQVSNYRWPHLSGLCLQRNLDVTPALRAFERACELNPQDVYAHYYAAALVADRGQTESAKRHYEAALEADPQCVAALLGRGELELREKHDEIAQRFLEQAANLAPLCGPVHRALAEVYAHQKDLRLSTRETRLASALSRDVPMADPLASEVESRGVSFKARMARADRLVAAGDRRAAIEEFKEALKLRPDSADAHLKLGDTLHDVGEFQQAVIELRRAAELSPQLTVARVALARAYAAQKDLAAAMKTVDEAIRREPGYAPAHLLKGQILESMQRTRDALAAFDRASQCDPNSVQAQMQRGEILLKQGRAREAVQAFRSAVDLRPDQAAGFNALGAALMDQANALEAIQAFQEAVLLDPNSLAARINLVLVLRASGRRGEADTVLQEARALWPHDDTLQRLADGQSVPIFLEEPH